MISGERERERKGTFSQCVKYSLFDCNTYNLEQNNGYIKATVAEGIDEKYLPLATFILDDNVFK